MCGILRVAALGELDPSLLDAVRLLRHRGPDGEGRVSSGPADDGLRLYSLLVLELWLDWVESRAGSALAAGMRG